MKTQIEMVRSIHDRLDELKLEKVILDKYAQQAISMKDDDYLQSINEGLAENEKDLIMTRATLKEMKESFRKQHTE